jgi:hypothetical protein
MLMDSSKWRWPPTIRRNTSIYRISSTEDFAFRNVHRGVIKRQRPGVPAPADDSPLYSRRGL